MSYWSPSSPSEHREQATASSWCFTFSVCVSLSFFSQWLTLKCRIRNEWITAATGDQTVWLSKMELYEAFYWKYCKFSQNSSCVQKGLLLFTFIFSHFSNMSKKSICSCCLCCIWVATAVVATGEWNWCLKENGLFQANGVTSALLRCQWPGSTFTDTTVSQDKNLFLDPLCCCEFSIKIHSWVRCSTVPLNTNNMCNFI